MSVFRTAVSRGRVLANAAVIGHLGNGTFVSGLLQASFIGRSRTRRFGFLVISEETEGFKWVPIRQSSIGSSFGTRTTTGMDMDDGIRGRVAGAFVSPDGKPIQVGGKTGSGDNRFKSFGRGGGVISSRAVNRTATFVFYIVDRYYGALSASVLGKEAEHFRFTSALPVAILKLLAPALNSRIDARI